MIISHKLKVIFIKTSKTAGSSFELALSKYCGPDDIYTKIASDTNIRKSWNIPESQNTKKTKFVEHISASKIKKTIPKNIWNSYLKVSIIRCPYDTIISSYYWNKFRKSFSRFVAIRLSPEKNLWGYKVICIDNRLVTDFLIRYEHLSEDIKKLEIKIGCPGLLQTFQNIKDKSNYRPPGRDIYTVYSQNPIAKAMIDKAYGNMMDNELVAKYYPTYKERLDQRVSEPRYFQVFVANLLLKYFSLKKSLKRKSNKNRRLSQ